jgi:glyoxylase-like metal-dependent hydrolase (beta-lactamase superfamily II)
VIVIRPDTAAPSEMTALGRRLVALAGGDDTRVVTGHGGFVVDNDLAAAYLHLNGSAQTPPPPDRMPPPLAAAVVERAEIRAGTRRATTRRATSSQGEPR